MARAKQKLLRYVGGVLLVLASVACSSKEGSLSMPPRSSAEAETADLSGRTPFVSPDSPLYRRVEGIGARNMCSSDADCMRSGCSGEVCSAERLVTTCEVRDWPHLQGAECGCVQGQCIWYR